MRQAVALRRSAPVLAAGVLLLAAAPVDIRPALATEAVTDDADDPAVWVHPSDPARSLILGTNKVAAPRGALVVFGSDGRIRQTVAGIDRPNNVDVEYGLLLGGKPTDIAVLTERRQSRLRVFRMEPDGSGVTEVSSGGGVAVFAGLQGDEAAPMGIGLYRRPRDGAVFAIVSRKAGPDGRYLWQYRLEDDGTGRVKATKVREFGAYSGGPDNEIEAVAVDDELGYVYYSDETAGVRKYHADPDHRQASRELAFFAREGWQGQREGIAIYAGPRGTGFVVVTDQLAGNSVYRLYRREGRAGNRHDHAELVREVRGGADRTDGIEVVARPMGAAFPRGALIAMNSSGRNFLLYRWEDVVAGLPMR